MHPQRSPRLDTWIGIGIGLLAFGIVFADAPAARAQGGVVGSIIGNVFDQTGQPLKGIKITATSATQIGGAKVAYTNEEGGFRLPGLQPGVFQVTASGPKLRTVVQNGIQVGVNAAASVDVVMEVETAVEEVKVVEKPPVVSTTAANVKEVYDEEFVDNLPVESRYSIEAFIGNHVPGATFSSVRAARIRGGGTQQNSFLVEGFQTDGQKLTVKSLAAFEVQTAGYGADYANTPGGVVNMVTKSGSNRYELDVSGYYEDSSIKFFRDASDVDARSWDTLINPAVSGPILKDRLWFYANVELRSVMAGRERDLAGSALLGDPPARGELHPRGSLKLTWQVTPRHKLQSYSNIYWDWFWNQSDVTRYEKDAQKRTTNFVYFHGVTWEALLADNVFLKSQAGVQRSHSDAGPMRCRAEPIDCDHTPQIRQVYPRPLYLQNFEEHVDALSETIEIINTIEWFLNTRRLGEHNLKARSRFFGERWTHAQSTPGDRYVQFNGSAPDLMREYYANDPRLDTARYGWRIRTTTGATTVHSISDAMRPTRHLTLNAGAALTTIAAENAGGDSGLGGAAVTPHVAVAWDATHDGKTALRGSFNQYVDTDAFRLARFALGDRVFQECRWDPVLEQFAASCRYGGGAQARTFGLPCGPQGVDVHGRPCREELRLPRTWEYTAGAEREITSGVSLGSDLVYRVYTFPYENGETNRIWNGAGTGLVPTGAYRNGRNETISDLGTPVDAERRYAGVTTSIRKREGVVKINMAYTWSRLRGNVDNNENNEFGENPGRNVYLYGDLPDDARHAIRTALTVQATRWLSLGLTHGYASGRPYSRKYWNEVTRTYVDYRARVGTSPGSDVNDPGDDRPQRLPDIQRVSAQARLNLKPLVGAHFEGYVDCFNLLALRTTTSVEVQDTSEFGQARGRMGPMQLRLGFRYRY
jgi:hypothetical protein